MDYQVDLDVFHGPLDLLLYLVKRDEIDLRDIPIARVAEQFKHYLDVLQVIDVERVGDFLVMAATLAELKSKMLLPRPEESGAEEEDPRQELVRQLLEYKRFKDAAALLEQQAERQAERLPRQQPPAPTPSGPTPLRPVELWDLVSAFGRLLRETLALQPQQISIDQTPVHVYMEEVLGRLRGADRLPLSRLFLPPYTRSRLVGYFLAILELTRRFSVQAEQDETFGDIWVSLPPPPPADEPDAPARIS
ncbi:MAG: segregation/condensation protein A [Planctomycetes bacterium]|nr:segregation/condensation protein A [Planctomycetota bacterium]